MSDGLVWIVGAVFLVLEITFMARDQRRRQAMQPPALGELHFRDGYMRTILADDPDDAIDCLIAGLFQ